MGNKPSAYSFRAGWVIAAGQWNRRDSCKSCRLMSILVCRYGMTTQQAVQGLQIDCELTWAQSLMVCVAGGLDLEIQEFGQVTHVIQPIIPETTSLLISSVIDPDMPPGQLQVLMIAAGIHG